MLASFHRDRRSSARRLAVAAFIQLRSSAEKRLARLVHRKALPVTGNGLMQAVVRFAISRQQEKKKYRPRFIQIVATPAVRTISRSSLSRLYIRNTPNFVPAGSALSVGFDSDRLSTARLVNDHAVVPQAAVA